MEIVSRLFLMLGPLFVAITASLNIYLSRQQLPLSIKCNVIPFLKIGILIYIAYVNGAINSTKTMISYFFLSLVLFVIGNVLLKKTTAQYKSDNSIKKSYYYLCSQSVRVSCFVIETLLILTIPVNSNILTFYGYILIPCLMLIGVSIGIFSFISYCKHLGLDEPLKVWEKFYPAMVSNINPFR